MKNYQEHTGIIIKKHCNFFGRHTITIDTGLKKLSFIVGKAIYDTNNIGQNLTIGLCGKKLVNIRPFKLSEEAIIWNKFIDNIVPRDLETLNRVQKNAVLSFCYDAEMNSGGHSGFFDCYPSGVSNKEIETALFEIGASVFVPNFIEAYTNGIKNEYKKTDDYFYHIKPSLTGFIEKYVLNNRKEMFK